MEAVARGDRHGNREAKKPKTLKPKEKLTFELELKDGSPEVSNAITGRVSYIGAALWDRVSPGQTASKFFQTTVEDSQPKELPKQ